jgi:hypothetical protein
MPVARARKLKGVPRGGPFCRSWWITSDARAEQDLAEVISASGGRPEPAELSPAPTCPAATRRCSRPEAERLRALIDTLGSCDAASIFAGTFRLRTEPAAQF